MSLWPVTPCPGPQAPCRTPSCPMRNLPTPLDTHRLCPSCSTPVPKPSQDLQAASHMAVHQHRRATGRSPRFLVIFRFYVFCVIFIPPGLGGSKPGRSTSALAGSDPDYSSPSLMTSHPWMACARNRWSCCFRRQTRNPCSNGASPTGVFPIPFLQLTPPQISHGCLVPPAPRSIIGARRCLSHCHSEVSAW